MNLTTTIPYEDYKKLVEDSADKSNVIAILNTKFKDAECQLTAIKSVLGIEEETQEPADPDTQEPSGTTAPDPLDPSTP